jgi:hypothetical protein
MRDGGATERPQLVVDAGDLPATAEALRDLFATSGRLFDSWAASALDHTGGWQFAVSSAADNMQRRYGSTSTLRASEGGWKRWVHCDNTARPRREDVSQHVR